MTDDDILNIAKVCHEAHRAWCAANGDHVHKPWDEAEPYQREGTIWGVRLLLRNPDITDEEHHDLWWMQKLKEGWRYEENRNGTAKTHPGMVPYSEMPEYQRKKKPLFRAIVMALSK
jgi:hypothetical protein